MTHLSILWTPYAFIRNGISQYPWYIELLCQSDIIYIIFHPLNKIPVRIQQQKTTQFLMNAKNAFTNVLFCLRINNILIKV